MILEMSTLSSTHDLLGGFCQVRSPPRRTRRGVLSSVVSSGFSAVILPGARGKSNALAGFLKSWSFSLYKILS